MLGEVIGAGKTLGTVVTFVGLNARVGASMASELVGAREAPAAVIPVAGVRLLSQMPTQMRLEVGGLGVQLVAAAEGAQVALLTGRILAKLHCHRIGACLTGDGDGRRTGRCQAQVVVAFAQKTVAHVSAEWRALGQNVDELWDFYEMIQQSLLPVTELRWRCWRG